MIAQLLIALLIQAQPIEGPLADTQQEARAQALMRELRCVVCQNEPVSQSTADMAVDARRSIRRQIAEGASDEEVRAYFVSRYGQYVSFRPPLDGWGIALWALPFALIGGAAVWFGRRFLVGRRKDLAPLPDDRGDTGA